MGKSVQLWISDKQDAFVKGIAAEFPGVPHRYCGNHFVRDLAKPVLAADSHAKVQMRRKVRGLRGIEKAVLKQERESARDHRVVIEPEAALPALPVPVQEGTAALSSAAQVVLDYSAAVRGILNDDQGGPLHPPGLRMAEALGEVRESIQRNLNAKKGDSRKGNWNV